MSLFEIWACILHWQGIDLIHSIRNSAPGASQCVDDAAESNSSSRSALQYQTLHDQIERPDPGLLGKLLDAIETIPRAEWRAAGAWVLLTSEPI